MILKFLIDCLSLVIMNYYSVESLYQCYYFPKFILPTFHSTKTVISFKLVVVIGLNYYALLVLVKWKIKMPD